MKIIHCADLHLDSVMNTNFDPEKARTRRAELLAAYVRLVEYAAKNHVRAIIIAGDLFDTRNISATTRNAVLSSMTDNPGIAFFYLKGNHDQNNFLSGIDSPPENLFMFDSKWSRYELDGICIYGKEAPGCHGLVLDKEDFNIVILHGQESESAVKDHAEIIDLKTFKNQGIDYLALGHIHSYKKGTLDARGTYCYPGCLEGRGFDECTEHGFVLLDIDGKEKSFRQEFVPFALRQIKNARVDISECLSTAEILKKVNQEILHLECRPADLLKVTLTGECDVESEKNPSYIKAALENRFFAVKVEDLSSLKFDADRYRLDRSLKGEFVRMVMADREITEEEKAAVIRYGLQAISGEEIS